MAVLHIHSVLSGSLNLLYRESESMDEKHCYKITQRVHISDKATHYPHIDQIRDLESQHGDPKT